MLVVALLIGLAGVVDSAPADERRSSSNREARLLQALTHLRAANVDAAIGVLVDGAAILNQTMLARCSYGPYSRAMVRISSGGSNAGLSSSRARYSPMCMRTSRPTMSVRRSGPTGWR